MVTAWKLNVFLGINLRERNEWILLKFLVFYIRYINNKKKIFFLIF